MATTAWKISRRACKAASRQSDGNAGVSVLKPVLKLPPQGTWLVLLTLFAAGCASPPAAPPPAPPPPAPAPPRPSPPAPEPSAQARFEKGQRETARHALQEGRWSDAAWAWDVVLALHAHDAEARAGRQEALAATASGAAERLRRAQQAQQRGDWETAQRLHLEVLALDPLNVLAADALRHMERQRTKRGVVTGSFSAYGPAFAPPRPQTAAQPPPAQGEASKANKSHRAHNGANGKARPQESAAKSVTGEKTSTVGP